MSTPKIYTRTGDKGDTSLFTGQRVSKDDSYVNALGTVDECNCAIGVAIAHLPKGEPFHHIKNELETIQHALFDLGAALATPRTTAANAKIQKTRFDSDSIKMLESAIDRMEESLSPLKTFILPGGHPAGAALHLARSITRRCERLVVPINRQGDVSDDILIYLNRLSDYLFVLSRYANALTHSQETKWEPHKHAEGFSKGTSH